jgi:hypothetical protein
MMQHFISGMTATVVAEAVIAAIIVPLLPLLDWGAG